jgi:hypothetical protein
MTTTTKKSPILFSLVFAGAVLLFLSIFPIWEGATGFKDGGEDTAPSTFWGAVSYLSVEHWDPDRTRGVFLRNLRTLAIVLAGGVVLGRLVYWLLWEQGRKVEIKQSEMKLNE